MQQPIRKAVIPVAGLGTRLLPVTKSVPKELLPLVDTPAMQVVVEECIASGIEEIILITSRGKGTITDYFDYAPTLESVLEERGKLEELEAVRRISTMIRTISVRQKEPLGLGHAVLCARDVVGDEPFLVILPDDVINSNVPAAKQLLDVYNKYHEAVIALMEVPSQEVSRYGIVSGEKWAPGLFRVRTLIEKPDPKLAPTNLAIIGRYILPPIIFDYLETVEKDHSGEIQLTDALIKLVHNRALIGCQFEGIRHDIGDRLGYITANISYGLERPNLRQELLTHMTESLIQAGVIDQTAILPDSEVSQDDLNEFRSSKAHATRYSKPPKDETLKLMPSPKAVATQTSKDALAAGQLFDNPIYDGLVETTQLTEESEPFAEIDQIEDDELAILAASRIESEDITD